VASPTNSGKLDIAIEFRGITSDLVIDFPCMSIFLNRTREPPSILERTNKSQKSFSLLEKKNTYRPSLGIHSRVPVKGTTLSKSPKKVNKKKRSYRLYGRRIILLTTKQQDSKRIDLAIIQN
jgi:hypothetical protein